MTTATNPNLSIFKTLISVNAGPGCSRVKTNASSNFLNGDELFQLETRVRIYEKRKIMYAKTDAAAKELDDLEALVQDAAAKDKFASSSKASYKGQKDEVENKLKSWSDEFLKAFKILEDEDNNARGVAGAIDLRDANGLAPAVAGGPFKNSDVKLVSALAAYRLDQGAYKTVENVRAEINKFNQELQILERISPLSEEQILTRFNFNPWDTARSSGDGLNELAQARTARERLITDYVNAFNGYQPTDAAEKQTKIDTYVNPSKATGDSVGSANQFPVGKSGLDIIHEKSDADLQLDIQALNNLQSTLSAQIGGTQAAKAAYSNEFGVNGILDPKVEVQIAGLASASDVQAAAVKRRQLVGKLKEYNTNGVDIPGTDDAGLKLLLDENEGVYQAYYNAYNETPDLTFQQTSNLTDIIQKTTERTGLNRRAEKIYSIALAKALQLNVGTDNDKYLKAVEKREGMVKQFEDLGGPNQNSAYKSLDDNLLQQELDVRKALIDQVKDLYDNLQLDVENIKKLKNSDVQAEINKRDILLTDYAARGLNPDNDGATYSDQVIKDKIKAHDDAYNAAISDITIASGVAKVGDAATNSPPLKDLQNELKILSDKRKQLLAEAKTIQDSNDANLDINGTRLSNVVASLSTSQLSNAEIERKIKEIEVVTKSTNSANAYGAQLNTIESSIGVTRGLIQGIDMSDIQKAEGEATNLRTSLVQTESDLDSLKQVIDTDTSLSATQRKDLDTAVARIKALVEAEKINLRKKDDDIIDAKNSAANTQQNKARIKDYEARLTQQNFQSSSLTDEFNVTYETSTDNAISLLGRLLGEEQDRISKLSTAKMQEENDFVEKIKELEAGAGDFQAGEEVSITLQSLSNFDAPDQGTITGDSGKSQRTAFATEIKRGSKVINLIQSSSDLGAPFKSLDLGWEETDSVDRVFISSWARLVPNRDNAEGIDMLKTLGLDWLTSTLYVDMLDRTRVFTYEAFLRHYIDLLTSGQNKDVSKRAEYTNSDGTPVLCSVILPSNKTLGGIFGVPVDKVTVGVAQDEAIEFLAAPSIGGLIKEIRSTLIQADKPANEKSRYFPNKDERKDINDILKTFFIVDGNGVKAYPTADVIDVEDDATFGGESQWRAVLDGEAQKPEQDRVYLATGTDARSSYDSQFFEKACADAAFAFIQSELLDLTKIKLRVHRIQPYGNMQTQGAQNKAGKPYLCLQCSGKNDYCVLIKDNRSPEFDFSDESRQLYIFNTDGKDLEKHNLAKASAVTTAANTGNQSFLDTDDEDVSNFRFIPNI